MGLPLLLPSKQARLGQALAPRRPSLLAARGPSSAAAEQHGAPPLSLLEAMWARCCWPACLRMCCRTLAAAAYPLSAWRPSLPEGGEASEALARLRIEAIVMGFDFEDVY